MRILLAMSGGIDSSVVAHILKEEGHDLIGIRFILWTDPLAPAQAQILSNKCCDAQSAARAKYISKSLGFPLHTIDLSEIFKREVVDYYLKGCRTGITPNPCIRCNRLVRFGALLDLLEDFKCEKLATGHYARIKHRKTPDGSGYFALLEAKDRKKDQSYFLYRLSQEHLSRLLFPLGSMNKKKVFKLAEKYAVPLDNEHYRESQNLCFFPEKTPREFLKRHLKNHLKPGAIVMKEGKVIGTHEGLPLYTIGQRRIGIGGLETPLEVIGKNIGENKLIVGKAGKETVNKIFVRDIAWTSGKSPSGAIKCKCRSRSLASFKKGIFTNSGKSGEFEFKKPHPPLSPGQSLVIYKGNEILGGGVIAARGQN